jgi:hypothetical protein
VLELGEEITLFEEAAGVERIAGTGTDDLDRDFLFELAIDALGFVDRAHAAFADGGEEFIGTEALAFESAEAGDRLGGFFNGWRYVT